MAEEAGAFALDDVVGVDLRQDGPPPSAYLRRRGEQAPAGKRSRPRSATRTRTSSALAGVACALPALLRAEKLQKRAARVGFDWPDAARPARQDRRGNGRGRSRGQRRRNARPRSATCCSPWSIYARHLGIDPEAALRGANAKFETRFRRDGSSWPTDRFAELDLDDRKRFGSGPSAEASGVARDSRPFETRPVGIRQPHFDTRVVPAPSTGCCSSTSPWAWSQATPRRRRPAASMLRTVDALAAAASTARSSRSLDPFPGQRRDRQRHPRAAPPRRGRARASSASSRSILFQASIIGAALLRRRRSRRAPARHRARCASLSGCDDVADMDDQVGRDHFLQRRAEGRDELGRQVGDEADRVRQDRLVDAGQRESRASSGRAWRTADPPP